MIKLCLGQICPGFVRTASAGVPRNHLLHKQTEKNIYKSRVNHRPCFNLGHATKHIDVAITLIYCRVIFLK